MKSADFYGLNSEVWVQLLYHHLLLFDIVDIGYTDEIHIVDISITWKLQPLNFFLF